jgi:hypothetical protein
MSLISDVSVVIDREERFVSISGPIVFLAGFIKLGLQVDNACYLIYKNLTTGEWSTDITAGDRIGNNYFKTIGLAIDKTVRFRK